MKTRIMLVLALGLLAGCRERTFTVSITVDFAPCMVSGSSDRGNESVGDGVCGTELEEHGRNTLLLCGAMRIGQKRDQLCEFIWDPATGIATGRGCDGRVESIKSEEDEAEILFKPFMMRSGVDTCPDLTVDTQCEGDCLFALPPSGGTITQGNSDITFQYGKSLNGTVCNVDCNRQPGEEQVCWTSEDSTQEVCDVADNDCNGNIDDGDGDCALDPAEGEGEGEEPECFFGQERECTCTDQRVGTQACNRDNQWFMCQCDDPSEGEGEGEGEQPDPCARVATPCQTGELGIRCEGNERIECFQYQGGNNCLGERSLGECGFGCTNGSCDPDPCIGVSCPDEVFCDELTLVTRTNGQCVQGQCVHEENAQECGFSCDEQNRRCIHEDICANVVCNQPDQDFCLDDGTGIVIFEALGVCDPQTGRCTYENSVELCSNPPRVLDCDADDPGLAHIYQGVGTCQGGACQYDTERTRCAEHLQCNQQEQRCTLFECDDAPECHRLVRRNHQCEFERNENPPACCLNHEECNGRLVCENFACVDPCDDECALDAQRCSEGGDVQTCVPDQQQCLVWENTQECDFGCEDDPVACAPEPCEDTCDAEGVSACGEDRNLYVCTLGDDGCLHVVLEEDCVSQSGDGFSVICDRINLDCALACENDDECGIGGGCGCDDEQTIGCSGQTGVCLFEHQVCERSHNIIACEDCEQNFAQCMEECNACQEEGLFCGEDGNVHRCTIEENSCRTDSLEQECDFGCENGQCLPEDPCADVVQCEPEGLFCGEDGNVHECSPDENQCLVDALLEDCENFEDCDELALSCVLVDENNRRWRREDDAPINTDLDGNLRWRRNRVAENQTYAQAQNACPGGWRLPTISEARTTIIGCEGAETDGACPVADESPNWNDNQASCFCNDVYNGPDGQPGVSGCYRQPNLWSWFCNMFWTSTEPGDHQGERYIINAVAGGLRPQSEASRADVLCVQEID